MKRELNVSQDLVERLFARLDDLIDIHLTFLQSLVRAQQCSTDKSIEAFGPLLLQQVRSILVKHRNKQQQSLVVNTDNKPVEQKS